MMLCNKFVHLASAQRLFADMETCRENRLAGIQTLELRQTLSDQVRWGTFEYRLQENLYSSCSQKRRIRLS